MFRTLDLYLFRQLALFAAMLIGGFLAIAITMRSLEFVDLIVNRGLPISDFFKLVALLAPTMLQVVVPFSCAIAIIFIYNRLQSDNELIVKSASGISPLRLKAPAITLAALLSGALVFNGFFAMPNSFREFRLFKDEAGARFASSMIRAGEFLDFGSGRTMFIERIEEGKMFGVMIRDETVPSAPSTLFAEEGEVLQAVPGGTTTTILRLREVAQIGIDKSTGAPFRIDFQQHVIQSAQETSTDLGPFPNPRMLNFSTLREKIAETRAAETPDVFYERRLVQSYHERIITPLHLLAVTLLTLNILLAADRSRRGIGRYILVNIALLVAFEITATMARDSIRDDVANVYLPYVNVGAIFLSAFFLPGLLKRLLKS